MGQEIKSKPKNYKKGENTPACRPSLTRVVQLEEINGGVDINGGKEEEEKGETPSWNSMLRKRKDII